MWEETILDLYASNICIVRMQNQALDAKGSCLAIADVIFEIAWLERCTRDPATYFKSSAEWRSRMDTQLTL